MIVETLGNPLVLGQPGADMAASAAVFAKEILVTGARCKKVSTVCRCLTVAPVADDQPLVGVVHHQAGIEAFDRVHELRPRTGQLLFVLFSLGQVVQRQPDDRTSADLDRRESHLARENRAVIHPAAPPVEAMITRRVV